jgi:hypothetical protein
MQVSVILMRISEGLGIRAWKRLDGSRCEAKHDCLFGVRQSIFFSVTSATKARQLRAMCGVALGIRVVLDNYAEFRGSLFPGSVHACDR